MKIVVGNRPPSKSAYTTSILILHREKYKNALNLEITSAVKQGQWGPHTKSIIAVLLVQLVHSYYIITILRKKWL